MSNLIRQSNYVGNVDLKTPHYNEPDVAVIGDKPEHVNVICVQSGVKYKEEFVNKLRNSVARNLSIPHTFTVLRDEDVKEEDRWGGWWSKINLFNPEYTNKGLCLYLDLDVVITGSLDDLVACQTHKAMTIIKNFSMNIAHCAYNSSAMLWQAGDPRVVRIYEQFKKNPGMVKDVLHGDQCWVWRTLKDDAAVFPKPLVCSYKYDCRAPKGLPIHTRVVVFHGSPDPNEVNDEWVKQNWK